MPLKLHYFAGAGRAEVSRLLFTIGNVPFEDVTYTYATFAEFKAKTPFGQVPVLEFEDGSMLAQSGAIDRYVAKLTGLYPEDPKDAAFADMVVFHVTDFMDLFMPTWTMPAEEKVKARQDILAGKGGDKLKQLEKIIEKANAEGGGWLAGGKLSFADVVVFTYLSGITSPIMEGIPKDLLNSYPAIKAFRNKIANLPAVKAYYQDKTEESRASYKPDP
ncbi:hypothetical protein CHLRE_16g682725v5 [Chlamydomonas reinhardtii]|jgi:glutathione S-transferase|uniref:Uncharacterized protein n=1 Tax=Chlamydomonas reinhardtii TaxID=3055 RepID=A8JBB4_CHLRE|nr:uncharacterized protein CHLRE_16g682725v5 [Chlamydomonas reinhardtii]PNW71783.1 hypothetical protein CHLRE_16g682725v5 [Chlamydomonas reinhardtii]|eukprot:XP_001699266.1 glutathione S-transferase [Chlamydomonas reinhardtii]